MNVLRTINNPEIGDIFEIFNPPVPIWKYAVVTRIEGDINLQPFDLADPSRFVIPPAETLPATAGAYGLNPFNTRFVREFPYTRKHTLDQNGVLRYYAGPKPINPPGAGGSKRHRLRRKRKGTKKRGKSRKQGFRKR